MESSVKLSEDYCFLVFSQVVSPNTVEKSRDLSNNKMSVQIRFLNGRQPGNRLIFKARLSKAHNLLPFD